MKQTIKVTREDIRNGRRKSTTSCPIANAIKRTFKKKNVCVGVGDFCIGKKEFLLSKRAKGFISRFDSYKKVNPFQFSVVV